ncbi:MAG: hypothetical protein ACFC03_01830 [Candidatus Malihini olakiniferum]
MHFQHQHPVGNNDQASLKKAENKGLHYPEIGDDHDGNKYQDEEDSR